MFHLISHNKIEITFDVVGVSDALPSFALYINVVINSEFQTLNLLIKECWIECCAFDKFVSDVYELKDQNLDEVKLSDLSDRPVIVLSKSTGELILNICSSDSLKETNISAQCSINFDYIGVILENLNKFDKWW